MSGRPPPRLPAAPMPFSGMPTPPMPPFPAPCGPLPIGVPVGSVMAFAGPIFGQEGAGVTATSTAPSGWLVCDGRKLHRAKFPELFAVIGYRYLLKDETPSVVYRLPDLQGYFLRGVDPTVGKVPRGKDPTTRIDPDDAGRTTAAGALAAPLFVGSLQGCALQRHEHTSVELALVPATAGEGGPVNTVKAQGQTTTALVAEDGDPAPLTSEDETRAVNVGVYYIIKVSSGVWPWTAPFGGAFGG